MSPMRLTSYRVAKEIGVPAPRIGEIVRGKRSVSGEWTMLEQSMPAGSLTWLKDSGSAHVTNLPRKPAPAPLVAAQRMVWLEAFVTNRIPGTAGT